MRCQNPRGCGGLHWAFPKAGSPSCARLHPGSPVMRNQCRWPLPPRRPGRLLAQQQLRVPGYTRFMTLFRLSCDGLIM
jgi:hypothetical protein